MASKIVLQPSLIFLILFRKENGNNIREHVLFPYSLYKLRLQLYGVNILKWTYMFQTLNLVKAEPNVLWL